MDIHALPIVPLEYTKSVCHIGEGHACCRYLVASGDGFECAKDSSLAPTIDARVASGSFTARGDNCPGYGRVS